MERAPLGEILDGMGVRAELGDEDRVTDAVVLLKVENSDGEVAVVIEHSDRTNWFDQRALVNAAAAVVDGADLEHYRQDGRPLR